MRQPQCGNTGPTLTVAHIHCWHPVSLMLSHISGQSWKVRRLVAFHLFVLKWHVIPCLLVVENQSCSCVHHVLWCFVFNPYLSSLSKIAKCGKSRYEPPPAPPCKTDKSYTIPIWVFFSLIYGAFLKLGDPKARVSILPPPNLGWLGRTPLTLEASKYLNAPCCTTAPTQRGYAVTDAGFYFGTQFVGTKTESEQLGLLVAFGYAVLMTMLILRLAKYLQWKPQSIYAGRLLTLGTWLVCYAWWYPWQELLYQIQGYGLWELNLKLRSTSLIELFGLVVWLTLDHWNDVDVLFPRVGISWYARNREPSGDRQRLGTPFWTLQIHWHEE